MRDSSNPGLGLRSLIVTIAVTFLLVAPATRVAAEEKWSEWKELDKCPHIQVRTRAETSSDGRIWAYVQFKNTSAKKVTLKSAVSSDIEKVKKATGRITLDPGEVWDEAHIVDKLPFWVAGAEDDK